MNKDLGFNFGPEIKTGILSSGLDSVQADSLKNRVSAHVLRSVLEGTILWIKSKGIRQSHASFNKALNRSVKFER